MYNRRRCLTSLIVFGTTCLIIILDLGNVGIFNRNASSKSVEEERILNSKCSCRQEVVSITTSNKFYQIDLDLDGGFKIEKSLVENITCDLYKVFRRGPLQKVIGLSLYGKKSSLYSKELKTVIKQMAKYYPEWVARIYHDEAIDNKIICELECLKESGQILNNVDFCNISEIPNKLNGHTIHAMMWRWFPIGDPFVDIFMSRDTDSWITQREYDAVSAWLNTNKLFHVMRGKCN